MIIIEDVMQVLDRIEKTQDPILRSQLANAAVTQAIASAVYYIVVGTVVIVLGRRIVNATQKAWKESRREPM
jgi:hypothetical protein